MRVSGADRGLSSRRPGTGPRLAQREGKRAPGSACPALSARPAHHGTAAALSVGGASVLSARSLLTRGYGPEVCKKSRLN